MTAISSKPSRCSQQSPRTFVVRWRVSTFHCSNRNHHSRSSRPLRQPTRFNSTQTNSLSSFRKRVTSIHELHFLPSTSKKNSSRPHRQNMTISIVFQIHHFAKLYSYRLTHSSKEINKIIFRRQNNESFNFNNSNLGKRTDTQTYLYTITQDYGFLSSCEWPSGWPWLVSPCWQPLTPNRLWKILGWTSHWPEQFRKLSIGRPVDEPFQSLILRIVEEGGVSCLDMTMVFESVVNQWIYEDINHSHLLDRWLAGVERPLKWMERRALVDWPEAHGDRNCSTSRQTPLHLNPKRNSPD